MKTFFKIQTIIGYKSIALKQWIYHYRTSFAGLLRIINKEWVGIVYIETHANYGT